MASDKQEQSDISLFQQAVQDVEPLAQAQSVRNTALFIKHTHPVIKKQTHSEADYPNPFSDLLDQDLVGNEEFLAFRRSGIQKRLFSRLKSGHIPIEAELDLHGMTVQDAHQKLAEFLHHCRQDRLRCIRLIHGKGWSSKDHRPILKTKINSWLRQDDSILAFCSATLQDGGTGAVYVLLRRK